jgi:hypothetical protein
MIAAVKRKTAGTCIALVLVVLSFQDTTAQTEAHHGDLAGTSKLSYWAYDALDLPALNRQLAAADRKKQKKNNPSSNTGPIIIAVVDDAFRLSHKDLADFIYTNPLERPANAIDDDGNGKADDISGWDISDHDNNVSPPQGREEQYFHGTFITGTIITLLRQVYGEDASKLFKILPVKVLSDHEQVPFLKDGYKGIAYAIEQGADVICLAWSGGEATQEEQEIVAAAGKAGIALIGSAGNAYTQKVDYPAALEGFLAVAGIDTLFRKIPESNYGADVDLVAPARNIRAAHPLADNAYFYGAGTSGSAGLVTGCVAVLRAVQREATPDELYNALVNTATPVDQVNPSFTGKLGAGIPSLAKAARYLENPGERADFFSSVRTRGTILLETQRNTYAIQPEGAYSGFTFTLPMSGKDNRRSVSARQHLSFFSDDTLFYASSLDQAPAKIFIPGSSVELVYSDDRIFRKPTTTLSYAAVPIDSSTLFCSGTSRHTLPSGEISDGSGAQEYANNSSCMWQITVDEGKQVSFRFSEFDTEPAVDFVYLFDGESSIPGNLIAKFSGPEIPPQVTSRTNSVLVWFVSDGRNTGKGWKMTYTATSSQ